jgi:hypothetical protein
VHAPRGLYNTLSEYSRFRMVHEWSLSRLMRPKSLGVRGHRVAPPKRNAATSLFGVAEGKTRYKAHRSHLQSLNKILPGQS